LRLLYENKLTLGYGMDDGGFWVPAGAVNFLFITAPRPALGPTQPRIKWVPGAVCLGVMRLRREADHSPPSSA